VKCLISQLCEFFYKCGWAPGTASGCSIRIGGPDVNKPWRVFVAPSGVQKEDMVAEDVFEMDMNQNVVQKSKTSGLKLSASTPLWFIVYKHRSTAKCVVHTHSMNAHLATLLDPTEKSDVLRMTHLEMLKGVGRYAYDDTLEIPIIDNRPTEAELAEQFEAAILKYPKCNAVLVRRHGIYCWGDSWEQAKTQLESFDYLFECAIKMRQIGVNFSAVPSSGTFHVRDSSSQATKKRKIDEVAQNSISAVSGFNGVGTVNNLSDLDDRTIPLLPADSSVLLLDIEGCTTAISFVKDTLFPFVTENLDAYVKGLDLNKINEYLSNILKDIDCISDTNVKSQCKSVVNSCKDEPQTLKAAVRKLVALDVKATGLKAMQGHMWKSGYDSGELKGHIFADFKPLLLWCKDQNVKVCIYSSGSIKAQKLLFRHTLEGDLTPYLSSYFDTTSGGKKVASSYGNIAESLGVDPSKIVFVSDSEDELVAAREAGIGFPVMSVRPGNAPMTDVGKSFPIVHSLLQLCGSHQ